MADNDEALTLTDSLEDYLETVYELVRDKKFARVKEIARARGVRPGSVSPAMRRLAEMGLIEYVRREYIGLTPEGEERARRVVARHQLLCRLFDDILQMPPDAAEAEACAMEHSLTDEAMDRLVRFFEFLRLCPGARSIIQHFHDCQAILDHTGICNASCTLSRPLDGQDQREPLRLSSLGPGQRCLVTQVSGEGALRQRLLDMGIMPDVAIDIERVDPRKELISIRLQGFEVSLSFFEAEAVMITPV